MGRAAGASTPAPRPPALTRARRRRRPAGGRRGEKPKRVAVGLWVPALGGAGTDEGPRAVPGRLELRGAVRATAAAYVREPVARARLDLAEDVLRSLRARVETTLEDLALHSCKFQKTLSVASDSAESDVTVAPAPHVVVPCLNR